MDKSFKTIDYIVLFIFAIFVVLPLLRMIMFSEVTNTNETSIVVPYTDFEVYADSGLVSRIEYVDQAKTFNFHLRDGIENVIINPDLFRSSTETYLAEQITLLETFGFDVDSNIDNNYWLPVFSLLDNIESLSSDEFVQALTEAKENNSTIVFITTYPNYDDFQHEMLQKGIAFDMADKPSGLPWDSILAVAVPFAVMIFFYNMVFKNMNNDRSGFNETGLSPDVPQQGFESIGGHWETKHELQNIIDLINNRDISPENAKYIPRGYLLSGPPGTGKTALARAIAHETKCKFLYVCASDFVRFYVGQGASNVRKLMNIARKNSPCIIFLDEIDSLGTRGKASSAHLEYDTTINTLLTEMDGFKNNKDIIFIGATNFEESVDPALLRAGRLERKITINLPEYGERVEILNIYLKDVKCDDSVDVNLLAEQTAGFSGADLENLVKTAVLETIINKTEYVTSKDFDESFFKIVMKGNKRINVDPELQEKRNIIAYHESGHTLAHWLFEKNIPSKVTIVPSTSGAGGVTISTPTETLLRTKRFLKNQIKVLYGGRIAEEYLLKDENEITIGAQQDIKQATEILYELINYYGMNGSLINYSMLDIQNNNVEQMEPLAQELYAEAKRAIFESGELLEKLANELLKKKTLDKKELQKILTGEQDDSTTDTTETDTEIETEIETETSEGESIQEDSVSDISDKAEDDCQEINQEIVITDSNFGAVGQVAPITDVEFIMMDNHRI